MRRPLNAQARALQRAADHSQRASEAAAGGNRQEAQRLLGVANFERLRARLMD